MEPAESSLSFALLIIGATLQTIFIVRWSFLIFQAVHEKFVDVLCFAWMYLFMLLGPPMSSVVLVIVSMALTCSIIIYLEKLFAELELRDHPSDPISFFVVYYVGLLLYAAYCLVISIRRFVDLQKCPYSAEEEEEDDELEVQIVHTTSQFPAKFICSICRHSFDDAVHVPCCSNNCGHVFGRKCILLWLGSETKGCPVCMKPMDKSHLVKLYFSEGVNI
ncbi:hypothetical protein Gasu2_33390 [Galdieria sulphuraria]|nr:hypothetical protein Gasu2_33390 [Galdieria sulphuraria]